MYTLNHISESLETFLWDKIYKFFDGDADPGSGNLFSPGSGMENIRIRDVNPGSTTLIMLEERIRIQILGHS
jgi:hypothetical protein